MKKKDVTAKTVAGRATEMPEHVRQTLAACAGEECQTDGEECQTDGEEGRTADAAGEEPADAAGPAEAGDGAAGIEAMGAEGRGIFLPRVADIAGLACCGVRWTEDGSPVLAGFDSFEDAARVAAECGGTVVELVGRSLTARPRVARRLTEGLDAWDEYREGPDYATFAPDEEWALDDFLRGFVRRWREEYGPGYLERAVHRVAKATALFSRASEEGSLLVLWRRTAELTAVVPPGCVTAYSSASDDSFHEVGVMCPDIMWEPND